MWRRRLYTLANQLSNFAYQNIQQARFITERRKAEEALRESEQRFRSLVETTSDMVWEINQDGFYTYVSPKVEDLLGYRPDEVIGKSPFDLMPSETSQAVISRFQELMKDRRPFSALENLNLRKDGRQIMLETSGVPIFTENGVFSGYRGIDRNITDRKEAEKALRESEIRHRSILENTGTTMLILEEDMTISFANAEWEKLTGYRLQDVVGVKKWTEFVHKSDLERMIHQHRLRRTADANLAERSYEFRLVHRDGRLKDIYLIADMIPGTTQSVTSLIDITERKRAEAELHESRRRLEDIIEFLPDATMVIDKEGRPIAWNRAMETMTGVKKEDMLGKGDYEYALPFYGERRPVLIDFALHPNLETEKQYTALQRAGDTVFGEAYTPTLPSGNVHLSGTASVLRDSRGQVVGAIECLRDNTERKRLEERLGRAEKMEVLGTLAGGVAHELNNMLGLVVGYSELLAGKLTDNSVLKKYADNIYQSSIRGAAIIQDLLTLTGKGVTVSEVIDLNRVVVDCLRTQEFEKPKFYQPGVKIMTDLEDRLLNIQGSPIHLAKTIMNLVLNAAEFISGQGEVTIRTENRYLDKSIQVYDDIREGDYVVLTVSDTGRGISANDLGRIFEPFYTRKVMGISATGLELAVVWGTVKDHNGYIDVQSGEGKGTTFTLYFPATREKPEKVEKTAPSDSYGSKGESISVMDDVKE
ncbi:MAG: PAS domain S-box protein [Desulfobacterales bacterium]|nr:PAS domain S-box protein [Desulfobacterales bacterium]MDD3082928.1 PAS domain S-box protein [Desulfobacterales bacterium]MDD3951313.1 PAS domain S-box protein [Desulfobacterales bacterium]